MELEKGRVKYEIGIKTKIKIKYNKYKNVNKNNEITGTKLKTKKQCE